MHIFCSRFRSITQSYYRSAHALILVYDVTNQPTFDCCPDWLREIEEYASPKVLRVLVGNKIDRDDHEIPADVGEEFANRHGMYFLQVSSFQLHLPKIKPPVITPSTFHIPHFKSFQYFKTHLPLH